MKFFKLLIITSMAFIASSCSDEQSMCEMSQLEDTAKMYFDAELTKNWPEAYKLRRDKFKKNIPLKLYIEIMNKDSTDWEMLSYRLGDIKGIDTEIAELDVEIAEIPPSELVANREQINFKGVARFECKEQKWKVVSVPSRSHLSLNSEVVR